MQTNAGYGETAAVALGTKLGGGVWTLAVGADWEPSTEVATACWGGCGRFAGFFHLLFLKLLKLLLEILYLIGLGLCFRLCTLPRLFQFFLRLLLPWNADIASPDFKKCWNQPWTAWPQASSKNPAADLQQINVQRGFKFDSPFGRKRLVKHKQFDITILSQYNHRPWAICLHFHHESSMLVLENLMMFESQFRDIFFQTETPLHMSGLAGDRDREGKRRGKELEICLFSRPSTYATVLSHTVCKVNCWRTGIVRNGPVSIREQDACRAENLKQFRRVASKSETWFEMEIREEIAWEPDKRHTVSMGVLSSWK